MVGIGFNGHAGIGRCLIIPAEGDRGGLVGAIGGGAGFSEEMSSTARVTASAVY